MRIADILTPATDRPGPASQSWSPLRARRSRRATRARALRGMTLLEIMIVLAIIAVVMVLLVGRVAFNALQTSKTDITQATVRKLANEAYPQWSMRPANGGKCPTLVDLSEYMNSKVSNDPWGEAYVIKCGSDLPAGVSGIAILSKGEDKSEGTGDDIKSWE